MNLDDKIKVTCDISLKTWLSHKEVCVYTSLSYKTIQKARDNFDLPFITVMGRLLHERVVVDAWIKNRLDTERKHQKG